MIYPPSPLTEETKLKVGTGHMYRVVAERVAIRAAPSIDSHAQFCEGKGTLIEMFEWDKSRKWRQVVDKVGRNGWMMLDHPEIGPLLRPENFPEQTTPISPMIIAAMEGNVDFMDECINDNLDVNAVDATDRTPLML